MIPASDFRKWVEMEVKEQLKDDCSCDEHTIRRHIIKMWLLYSPPAGHA